MKAWFILKNSISRKLWRADFCSGRACDACCRLRREKISVYPSSFMLQNEGNNLHRALVARFGHKIAGFSTLLEEIDWEK